MSIVNTGLTRRILNFATGLHHNAVVSECEALDKRANDLFAAVDKQRKVVVAENERLEAIHLDALKAEDEAEAAWQAADTYERSTLRASNP